MLTVAIVSVVLSVLAILISLRAERHTRRQTELIEQDQEEKKREKAETAEWAPKCEQAVDACVRLYPQTFDARRAYGRVFPLVFDDLNLCRRIESYLIEADLGKNTSRARQIGPDQLRLPQVRQTIDDVLDRVKKFREAEPEYARTLGF
jgi:Na+-transporting methylmalonyl-CoA/oxaloacetate decarboxylase gamma subunit